MVLCGLHISYVDFGARNSCTSPIDSANQFSDHNQTKIYTLGSVKLNVDFLVDYRNLSILVSLQSRKLVLSYACSLVNS